MNLNFSAEDKFTVRMAATAIAWHAVIMNPKAHGCDASKLDYPLVALEVAKKMGDCAATFMEKELKEEAKRQERSE